MKKIVLSIIIIAVLILAGCSDGVANSLLDSTGSLSRTLTSIPTISPLNYDKTYTDEIHKLIQYGKLTFNIDVFHIVSQTQRDNSEIFKCQIDKDERRPKNHMTIKISEIEKKNFTDTRSVVSYLSEISHNYEKLTIYHNVKDESGIISLYIVTGGGQTKYIIYLKDSCYLIESDADFLEICMFKNDPTANYEENNLRIVCAGSFITNISKTIYYDKDKFQKGIYEIIQGKGGARYSAELSFNSKEYINKFTLINETGNNLLAISTETSGFYGDLAIEFLDVNMDGYVDIQILEKEGALNNGFALYVWDDSIKNFLKVKHDGLLSNFEVHQGFINNWVKESGNSGVIEKLVWINKYTLVKESEELYNAE